MYRTGFSREPGKKEVTGMAKMMKGKEVADSLSAATIRKSEKLASHGKAPVLAIIRLGMRPEDGAYERSALRRAALTGISVRTLGFDEDISQDDLIGEIRKLNDDDNVHGVLLLRPLPSHMDDRTVCEALAPEKDVDGITSGSMAGIFMGTDMGFPPCTAEACMEMLRYYDVDLKGKKVTIMGRSLVIGRPVAMMAMQAGATITICHSGTGADDFASAGRDADIVIAAVGRAGFIGKDRLGSGQVIIDVGINQSDAGGICGDVDFDEAEKTAAMITPVPGGVGNVTSAVLMKHVAEAAEKAAGITE